GGHVPPDFQIFNKWREGSLVGFELKDKLQETTFRIVRQLATDIDVAGRIKFESHEVMLIQRLECRRSSQRTVHVFECPNERIEAVPLVRHVQVSGKVSRLNEQTRGVIGLFSARRMRHIAEFEK